MSDKKLTVFEYVTYSDDNIISTGVLMAASRDEALVKVGAREMPGGPFEVLIRPF